ncbi:MAG: ferrochelatase [Planctomycetota bacterium]|nr:ferrochelatase [Pseudomonadota bacterium]MDA1180499.1 ferrochelatase [Planctomycetota bacterium]
MKTAVVLFNLGAPDRLESVGPFLRNLFSDPAILRVPGLFRPLLAWLIARRRAPEAKKIYAKIGGSSPLLAETKKQAEALEAYLNAEGSARSYGVFIGMRYWHPMITEAVQRVKAFQPDQVVLLPLYPQFSSTTTGSSFATWRRIAQKNALIAPTFLVCCYPDQAKWIESESELLMATLSKLDCDFSEVRILFSAHGLPKRIVDGGDPYPHQVEKTAQAIVNSISKQKAAPVDWTVCYQSKVGPLEWIGPSTESEIERAGQEHKTVVIAPISFVSEHSETLVELDMTFRALADRCGVQDYARVPTVGDHPGYICGLAEMVENALARQAVVDSAAGGGICDAQMADCPCSQNVHPAGN